MLRCLDMKFVLLHEARNDDGIKSFFMDVWELYVKVSVHCGPLFEYELMKAAASSDHAESLPHRALSDTQRCV